MRMRSMHWRLQQETKWTVSCGGLNTNTDLQRLIFTWFLTDKEITRLLLRHLLSKTLYIKTYNGGCLFLGQVCHTSLEGIVPLTNSIFCRKCLFLFFSPWKCNEQTWVAFVNEKLTQHLLGFSVAIACDCLDPSETKKSHSGSLRI